MKKARMCFCLVALAVLGGCSSSSSTKTGSISPGAVALSLGQSTQFQATLPGKSGSETWSVNGIAGGNATVGTITSTGLYTAPSDTDSIAVTITAASSGSSASSSATAQAYVVAPGAVQRTQNPQVALYTITPPAAANVTIQFGPTTSYGLSTWTQGSPTIGGPVSIFVAGMTANATYHMQATLQFAGAAAYTDSDHTFAAGTFPAGELPSIAATTTAGMTPQSGIELLDLLRVPTTTKVGVAVTDLNGNVLWAYAPGTTVPAGVVPGPVKLLPNGHFLIDFAQGQADGLDSIIQEVDLGGDVIWQLTAAQLNAELAAATCTGCNIKIVGTHHDFAILPNGHLIVIGAVDQVISGTNVTGDVLIDLDQNRNPVWVWNEFDHLDITRRPYMYPDWTHTNAVIYSPDDGNLIVSMRHQNWLVKVDYENGAGSGDVIWHLGYQGDFTLLNADGSTADPTNWFFAQHGPSFTTPNTTGKFGLAIFDDGDDRGVVDVAGGTCGVAGQPACYTAVPVLNLDETAMTATLAFDPVAPDYSFFGGNAEVLKNGNLEYGLCATTALPANNGAVYEITQTNPPQTVWQMQVAGQFVYRGMRTPSLYPGVQW
ncbi:MAG: aryl-sulfate sulfotransferase [Candidatus Acidiferrales bacterium]